MNRKFFIALFLSVVVGTQVLLAQAKREFRGAWIQCVNGQFLGLGKDRMQQVLRSQLDEMQKDGVNAIIFQVRPECDALYASPYEPWSRFFTGPQGLPPNPDLAPVARVIDAGHNP